jgi:hypothetical protein
MDNPTITIKHCRSNWDQGNQYEPVKITNRTYLWDAEEQSYCDGGGSCGGHGAKLQNDGKWLPSWTSADSGSTQFGSKSFDTSIEAIHESYSTWS